MQQSSINEKHTQAQGMWFQLLKKQKKKYKKYKNSVVIRTEGKRESKNTRVWANTTESRNWTNQRRKLELTCVRGPQETRGLGKQSSSIGLLSKGSSEVCVVGGVPYTHRWRDSRAQYHSTQWGDPQPASTEETYRKRPHHGFENTDFFISSILKPNLFSDVQISNPFKKKLLISL